MELWGSRLIRCFQGLAAGTDWFEYSWMAESVCFLELDLTIVNATSWVAERVLVQEWKVSINWKLPLIKRTVTNHVFLIEEIGKASIHSWFPIYSVNGFRSFAVMFYAVRVTVVLIWIRKMHLLNIWMGPCYAMRCSSVSEQTKRGSVFSLLLCHILDFGSQRHHPR